MNNQERNKLIAYINKIERHTSKIENELLIMENMLSNLKDKVDDCLKWGIINNGFMYREKWDKRQIRKNNRL